MTLTLPFGRTGMPLEVGAEAEVLVSHAGEMKPPQPQAAIVQAAMDRPVAGPALQQLARGKARCTVIVSDHTRPVPSKLLLPPMLAALRAGSPGIEITLLVATGFHRPSTEAELRAKLGDELFERERVVVHDSRDPAANVEIGVLPSGARCVVDRLAVETDLLVAEGFIEPHFFAGFSGGRKSVLPGVCDQVTVLGNHCAAFIDSPHARAGVLAGNPLHRDMVEACRLAKLQYILNVVLNAEKEIVAAFAGDPFAAHEAGCRMLLGACGVRPQRRGEIVVSTNGGYPLDQNLYQSVKGLTAAEAAAAPGAVLIMASACADGTGSEDFYQALKGAASPKALLQQILATPQDQTRPDQWEYQILARVLCNHRVIYVTDPAQRQTVLDMQMEWAPTLQQAVELARQEKGENAHLVVIPDGISVIVEPA